MKLNLKQVLDLNELAKPRFDSARRRDQYGFMYEATIGDDPVAAFENSRNRFGLEHAVAVGCMEFAMRQMGVAADLADSIVCNSFGELRDAITSGRIDPEIGDRTAAGSSTNHFFVGALLFVEGREHCAGTMDWIDDLIAKEVIGSNDRFAHQSRSLAGTILIDATTVYRLLKERLLSGLNVN